MPSLCYIELYILLKGTAVPQVCVCWANYQERIGLLVLANQKKYSSPPGLEPGIFWFVARRRDHWATRNKIFVFYYSIGSDLTC